MEGSWGDDRIEGGTGEGVDGYDRWHVRDLSCRLRCSLLLKALLQNWHLYLRSGASEAFREDDVEAAEGGRTATLAPGILMTRSRFRVAVWRQRRQQGDAGETGNSAGARKHDG